MHTIKEDTVPREYPKKARTGEVIIEMRNIVKRFPGVMALDHVNLEFRAGEIHALLGENGAGKTTLMNVLYGLYSPNEGEIFVRGKKVEIRSPKDSINLGIGMVHQHFKLVPIFTVAENVILGLRSSEGFLLNLKKAENKISSLSKRFGLKVNPSAKVENLSVGEKQRVEIIKALYRNCQILILDEPTSVLTPSEVKDLKIILQKLSQENMGVVPFITHKLREVLSISNRVTILRRGRVVDTVETKKSNERILARKMVGREVVLEVEKPEFESGGEAKVLLEVKDLGALNEKGLPALRNISFKLYEGEILGIAGVSGNGQTELSEILSGLRETSSGKVYIMGKDVTNSSPSEIIALGVGIIPEDRLKRGIIPNFSVTDNLILERQSDSAIVHRWFLPFDKKWFLNHENIRKYAKGMIEEYDIKTPNEDTLVKYLSGGNIQRLILARVLSRQARVLIANQPTRGLDVGATEFVRKKLIEQKSNGSGVLLISDDLDEVLMMSDRVAVVFEGEFVGMFSSDNFSTEKIGILMAGGKVN